MLLRRRRSSSLFTTRKHATLPFPMSLSAWHSSTVDSPSSLLACGSLSRVIRLAQPVSFRVLSLSTFLPWIALCASSKSFHLHSTGDGMTSSVTCGPLLLLCCWQSANSRFCSIVAFSSYGAFWLSFACLFIPSSGIAEAYATTAKTDPGMEEDAIGIFLLAWMVVTFLFL